MYLRTVLVDNSMLRSLYATLIVILYLFVASCSPMKESKFEKSLSNYHDREVIIDDLQKSFFNPKVNIKAHLAERPEIIFDAYMNKDQTEIQSYLPYAIWRFDFESQIKELLSETKMEMKAKVDFPEKSNPKAIPSFDLIMEQEASEVRLHSLSLLFLMNSQIMRLLLPCQIC